MIEVSDQEFEMIIADAMDALAERFLDKAKNVAIVWAYDPTPEQRKKLRLRGSETLFGLYEGIPLIGRGDNYSLVLPDKITIFKNPIVGFSDSIAGVEEQVRKTLWHELAHHYGLDHDKIHELEN